MVGEFNPGNVVSQNTGLQKDLDYSSVLQVRLDTSPIIEQIQTYLTGELYLVVYDQETGKPKFEKRKLSEPKANAEGIHWILNFVQSVVNPATVQGNFVNEESFYNYIYSIHSSMILLLMRNMNVWDIKPQDYEPIIDFIMALTEPFMSRLLANKERESYGGMRVIESSTIEQKNKGFSLNPFKRGT